MSPLCYIRSVHRGNANAYVRYSFDHSRVSLMSNGKKIGKLWESSKNRSLQRNNDQEEGCISKIDQVKSYVCKIDQLRFIGITVDRFFQTNKFI